MDFFRGLDQGYRRLAGALILSNLLSLMLFVARALSAQSLRFIFLPWNLVLAWMPLVFAVWLRRRLKVSSWVEPANIVLTLLWLGFLPNSFYLVSDLIHLVSTGEVSKLYDAVMFLSYIFNGYVAGFYSLYIIHNQLLKRIIREQAHTFIAGVFLMCGFAIYLGRYLRWNTWDILVNPFGLLFDVSERVINPVAHPQVFTTTLTFFLLLTTMYAVIWQFVQALRSERKK